MDTREIIQNFIPKMDSVDKIYQLFVNLNYPEEKMFDPSYRRDISDFDFAKEEKEKLKEVYTVLNFDGKLPVFLIETKTLPPSLIRYIAKHLAERYQRLLLIFTADYKEYTFTFPEYERVEVGKHKLKITRLIFDRQEPYHTDLETIANLAYGPEDDWRILWLKWRGAFNVEKVTRKFFEDYKTIFFSLRKKVENQGIGRRDAHEFSQQLLNRMMFIYFVAKKRWLNDDPKFLKWFWDVYRRDENQEEDSFCEKWLKVLFLEAFNNRFSHPSYLPRDVRSILQMAPYLNGGLFKKNRFDDLPVEIKDLLFKEIFNFFERYNFTIREDLPLDVEVAVDPQMIGYAYESLANVAEEIYDRQDLGIFYTPKIEVDFMARSCLAEYFCNHLPELPKEKIYQFIFDQDKRETEDFFSKQGLWERIEELLDNLAVVDPACGSGAFLVGMLNVLARLSKTIYQHLGREMSDFEVKKRIIGRSLYGVDVISWAVHAAELRLWLQLIIESDLSIGELKLQPLLPNLDLRLRVGDSLVQELGGIDLHIREANISPSLKGKLTLLKHEKEKYFNNDPSGKFKSNEALLREEIRIFSEIISERIMNLFKERQRLEGKKQPPELDMFEGKFKEGKEENIEQKQKDIDMQVEKLKEIKGLLKDPEKKPFVWDIDFAEIFGEKGGFDIVIGNPPYVRQEKISPPNRLKEEVTLEDRREYKGKLLKSVKAHFPLIQKINKKSDYYIYFYFHGLALLNPKGTFCFITSNSWLDVGYGKGFQEFLLKYVPIKAIYDNQARRSFEHADVNTIIALFGAPLVKDKYAAGKHLALSNIARFVMFKKPFEEVINSRNLMAILSHDPYAMSLFPQVLNTSEFRVFPLKQEKLLEEGWEYPEEAEKKEAYGFNVGKYTGNKWGGKYLRAPDIFFTILEKGKGKLVRLGDIAEVRRGFTTGCNEFFYLDEEGLREWKIEKEFLKPVIKSPRECKSILIRPEDLKF